MIGHEEYFELKEEHIKLASRFYIGWQRCDYGAPEIDPKRPYGNSDVEADICEILGWFGEGTKYYDLDEDERDKFFDGEGVYGPLRDAAEKIHKEMENALQIILKFKTFEPGSYYREGSWEEWKQVRD